MKDLNINIDHVATLRNARGEDEPSPILAAQLAEKAGATGIVCHLREDRRHIKDADVYNLKKVVKGQFDLEMALADDIVSLALDIKPDLITLVPEKREELTTEGGLNISKYYSEIGDVVSRMQRKGIKVSLFIEPDLESVKTSKKLGADLVELHTGKYANLFSTNQKNDLLNDIRQAAILAKDLGLKVAAGHGLNYHNTQEIAEINEIDELSIGHSLISYSIFHGISKATKDMIQLIKKSTNL
ncbi:pyridoxine 5'-phosphate synthase [Candidatus Kapabacteria bacterium]|nr:pyridoxine 5'-phosphate synthase [Candidatus Kapabacteria bacterium]